MIIKNLKSTYNYNKFINILKNSYLKFLNHASFLLESKDSILLVDPWLSGSAFNNGWALLDNLIKEEELINEIKNSKKQLFIWYSHEHSDHLSFIFLKKLILSSTKFTILFHDTNDKRVVTNLLKRGLKVKEQKDGIKFKIDDEISITTWKFQDNIDSYCLINTNEISILNLNDCIVNNKETAFEVKDKTKKISENIDILFTQFGYANWISNKENIEQRKIQGIEKNERIFIQNKFLNPKIIIPFASFIYFSNYDNFFTNDFQNTPLRLRNSPLLENIQYKISFMKPKDILYLENNSFDILKKNSNNAEIYWNNLFNKIKPISYKEKAFNFYELKKIFKKNRHIISLKLIFLPQILELIGFIKPVNIHIIDLDQSIQFSWLTEPFITKSKNNAIISINSNSLAFTFSNEYGIDALSVNGRFHENISSKFHEFKKFLIFQKFVQNGLTFHNPSLFFSILLKVAIKKIKNLYINFRK